MDYIRDLEAKCSELKKENERLTARVQELLEANTAVKLEKRKHSIRDNVTAFHEKFDHPMHYTPRVPDKDRLMFRLSFCTEEFFEMLYACFRGKENLEAIKDLEDSVLGLIALKTDPAEVDLPELIDALCDQEYVIEGFRLECGVYGPDILEEVQRANMAKHKVKNQVGKTTKPPGWTPPDIAGVLKKQGWVPPNE